MGMISGGLTLGLVVALLLLAVWLGQKSGDLRRQTGLPAGDVIYTDTGAWFPNQDVIHDAELRLVGKPDYLVEQADGGIIPVEIKSSRAPEEPREGHVLQLAGYCFLVHSHTGIRPEYGILQYQDKAFAVEYTDALEEDLLEVLDEMQQDMRVDELPRDHDDFWRCHSCGVRQHCRQRLTQP